MISNYFYLAGNGPGYMKGMIRPVLQLIYLRWHWILVPGLICVYFRNKSTISSFFPVPCPIIWGRVMVIDGSPPSFFPVPPYLCLNSQHPSTISSIFLFFQVVSSLLSAGMFKWSSSKMPKPLQSSFGHFA